MARKIERLTDRAVDKVKALGYIHDGAGLYLQVQAGASSLAKSWIYRYTLAGKTREMGIGAYPTFSLAEARQRAHAQRKLVADGVDPIEARDAAKARVALERANAVTFAECAKRYIAANRSGWKNEKHVAQWGNTIETYAAPVIGELAVQAVDTPQVLRILEALWSTKPETATRIRGRIERILDWAKVSGYRTGDNPARWRGHLDKILPRRSKVRKVENHPALPYAKVGAFVADLRGVPGVPSQALEFTILTAARTGEVIGAKPEEFDLEKAVWTIPPERMKAGAEHRVPLSSRAVAIIKAQPEGTYIFGGRNEGEPLSNMAMLKVLERMGKDDVTVHGFRSTFRDWAAECTNYPNEVCEMALAHTLSDKTEKAYRRGDLFEKRRKLMNEWARYCDTPKGSAKVLPIARRK